MSQVFDGELNEFALAQETVHAGVIRAGLCRIGSIRVRLRGRRHYNYNKEKKTHKVQRAEVVVTHRHIHPGPASIAVTIGIRSNGRRSFLPAVLAVGYNLLTD